jgi:alpha-D-xyloside xylohydrolase
MLQAPNPSTSLWSEVGDGIDYYFAYGPEIDHVVAGYRKLTGQASLMPRSAFGLWQSRERYQTAQQSLDALGGYRSRGIPIDNIVQDWQYWEEDQWGSHEFDASRFPDPEGWIEQIHTQNAKLMISVWPKFYTGTDNFDELDAAGFIYRRNVEQGLLDFVGYNFSYYDAFSAEARVMFWAQIERELMNKGVDALYYSSAGLAWSAQVLEPVRANGVGAPFAGRRGEALTVETGEAGAGCSCGASVARPVRSI